MNTLKMSDTPETDFHCWTDGSGEELIAVCKAEFCRKLERERDEAREKNAKLHYIVERAINYLNQSYRDGFADEVNDLRYEIEQLKEETK